MGHSVGCIERSIQRMGAVLTVGMAESKGAVIYCRERTIQPWGMTESNESSYLLMGAVSSCMGRSIQLTGDLCPA
jgi:hypothetical protein